MIGFTLQKCKSTRKEFGGNRFCDWKNFRKVISFGSSVVSLESYFSQLASHFTSSYIFSALYSVVYFFALLELLFVIFCISCFLCFSCFLYQSICLNTVIFKCWSYVSQYYPQWRTQFLQKETPFYLLQCLHSPHLCACTLTFCVVLAIVTMKLMVLWCKLQEPL